MDLADPAERLQMAGEVRPAHRDADAVVPAASARTTWRPRKPEPPKTVTSVSLLACRVMSAVWRA